MSLDNVFEGELVWQEASIGAVCTTRCPCDQVDIGRVASRECRGDFATGGRWEPPKVDVCQFSRLAFQLCKTDSVRHYTCSLLFLCLVVRT